MEKRRIRLEINGVVCGLITQESEEYMQSLAGEVGDLMTEIAVASPYITREAAALTVALSYCDDAKKNGNKAFELQERIDELEVEAELWQEEKAEMASSPTGATAAMQTRLEKLESENTALVQTAQRVKELEEKTARLEDENAALQKHSSDGNPELQNRIEALETEKDELKSAAKELIAQRSEYRERVEALEKENRELKEQPKEQPALRIEALEKESEALKADAEKQKELAEKAELEKNAAVAAAKRAVEEAKKIVDKLQEELKQTREEADKAKRLATAPALTALERMAEDSSGDSGDDLSHPVSRRRNPLRYEDDFEQEGFISFFEKKGKN